MKISRGSKWALEMTKVVGWQGVSRLLAKVALCRPLAHHQYNALAWQLPALPCADISVRQSEKCTVTLLHHRCFTVCIVRSCLYRLGIEHCFNEQYFCIQYIQFSVKWDFACMALCCGQNALCANFNVRSAQDVQREQWLAEHGMPASSYLTYCSPVVSLFSHDDDEEDRYHGDGNGCEDDGDGDGEGGKGCGVTAGGCSIRWGKLWSLHGQGHDHCDDCDDYSECEEPDNFDYKGIDETSF